MNESLFPHGRALFASPGTAYDLKYKINAWMEPDRQKIDKRLAIQQWTELVNTVIRLGVYAEVVSIPHPDGVFSANAGLVYNRHFVASSFNHAERQPEEKYWIVWAKKAVDESGKPIFDYIHTLGNTSFEGAGDALFVGHTLCCGWGFRTRRNAPELLGKLLDVEVLPLRLKLDKFYHLDTCFCPLRHDLVMFYPPAFADPNKIKERFKTLEVSTKDAHKFACNAVVIGDNILLPSGCDDTMQKLKDQGFNCYSISMSEYLKAGGAAKCLTLQYS